MDKKSVNPGLIFLLVLLVVIGIFLLYSRLTFTGYVTNVANATTGLLLSSFEFSNGDFSNTAVNSGGSVVLMPTKTIGTYTSQVFDAGQNVVWTNFVPTYVMHSSSNYTEDLLNNSIILYVRSCNDAACTGKDFALPQGNLLGQYFQYKAAMQILSGTESPVLSEVNVSYYPPISLPISIDSPHATVYTNESVPIKISTNQGVTTWFFNGTGNETYLGGINRTFSQGQHVLTAWVSYTEGNIYTENSTSVTFSVEFLKTFYRLASNACSQISLVPSQKTANDYNTLAECQSHITTTTTTTTETQSVSCSASWECEWGECVDGIQTESCTDTSTCTTVAQPPAVRTQSCTGGITTTEPVVTTPTPVTTVTSATTTPAKKGFFSFVGGAIFGPIFKSKVGVVFVILVVLVAGGLLAYKFLLKDKLKLKFKFFNKKRFNFFN